MVPSSASSAQHCPALTETGTLHATLATSFPTLHCALPTNDHEYIQVPLKIAPAHESVIPLPQLIVIGVEALVLFHLQVTCTLNPLLVVSGADQVILVQLDCTSGRTTESHACPVISTPKVLV